ncbi:MAG: glycogen synthase [Chloroflexota bacterium]
MPEKLKILFLASEADPFVKVGGLGDVAGSLPAALRALTAESAGGQKLDVRLMLPLHPVIRTDGLTLRLEAAFPMAHVSGEVQAQVYAAALDGLPVYFISAEPVNSVQTVYSSNAGLDAEKYVFFSLAALEATRHLGWQPEIIHANDWHTALACYALKLHRKGDEFLRGMRSLLTVHNLPFMGPNISAQLAGYGFEAPATDLPWWGNPLPLPLGLWGADAIVAVSPTYAREILTPAAGCGLETFLSGRALQVFGILNGIDTRRFDPQTDPALEKNYSAQTIKARQSNKAGLQRQLKLPESPGTPVLAVVSRLDPQKGMDLVFDALRYLNGLDWQAVLLGTGDAELETQARMLQKDFPDRVRAEVRFDARLANRIYAGSDMLMMPSRYEPCGLSQMIAMRYGSVPVARATGGLVDTIREGETGFVFAEPSAESLSLALRRAVSVYADQPSWQALQINGMARDFSWKASARQYAEVYQSLMKGRANTL